MPEAEPQNLRVLVADERQQYLEPVSKAVSELGHEVIGHEIEIARVGKATIERRPDVAIVALHEDDDHALEMITEIVHESTCPVMALVRGARRDFVAEAARRGIFAYVDSTSETELQGAIDVAFQRYREYRKLLTAFEGRARIERAKGILMERHGLDDQEAFDRLRTQARSSRRKLLEVVDEVLASEPEDTTD
ncbi:MAG: ANTAR domain-containing response regulator [Solirubrobacteraceae bacterium]|jgi:AmiR/NasT family two-component response regulator